jgi:serine/threonine protein kinase/predicted RNA-binding protein with RPS1 domain
MSYKVGDNIADKYKVTRDFTSAGGGTCQWGFGTYEGTEYFIKQFLTPVFPGINSPGTEKGKQKKREQCKKFELKHQAIQEALNAVGNDGLVVKTIDFFKYGNEYGEHYFKVCQKVDTSSISHKIHTLQVKDRLLVMITAAFALNILHRAEIIHLDLKPDNILIQERDKRQIAKLIDFDSSILEGESIAPEFLVGDQVYYSPEVAQYITNNEAPPPTNKSDIFSLGLIFCQYWTGKFPIFSKKNNYTYAYEAVINGEKLIIPEIENDSFKYEENKSPRFRMSKNLEKSNKSKTEREKTPIENEVYKLISRMLSSECLERPSISEVHQQLMEIRRTDTDEKEILTPKINKYGKKNSTVTYWYECKHCTHAGELFSEDISYCQVCESYDIRVKLEQVWDWIINIKASKQIVLVKVTGQNRGGVLVDIQGLRGFIPRSHLAKRDNLEKLVGQTLTAIILEFDQNNEDVVLSHREATALVNHQTSISKFEKRQLVEGKIVKILVGTKPFALLVDIGNNIKAKLHISEISQSFVSDIPSLFKVEQQIKAVIIDINYEKGQIYLSTKFLENYPGEILTQMKKVMTEAEVRWEKLEKG